MYKDNPFMWQRSLLAHALCMIVSVKLIILRLLIILTSTLKFSTILLRDDFKSQFTLKKKKKKKKRKIRKKTEEAVRE